MSFLEFFTGYPVWAKITVVTLILAAVIIVIFARGSSKGDCHNPDMKINTNPDHPLDTFNEKRTLINDLQAVTQKIEISIIIDSTFTDTKRITTISILYDSFQNKR